MFTGPGIATAARAYRHVLPAAVPDTSPLPATQSSLAAALRVLLAGVDDGARAAVWIAEDLTGVRRARVLAFPDAAVAPDVAARALAIARRRAAGEPLQYALGHADFHGLRLAVTPAVLIPRPETEELVEHALTALRGRSAPRVLDAGTGSGAIALAIKAARPDADVHALDVSRAALDVARANAAALGLDVMFHTADLLADHLPPTLGGAFDLVVSNPPYIPDTDAASLEPHVRDHEPALALFTGPDALVFYHALARHGARHIADGGVLWCELDADHADATAACFSGAAWASARVETDAARRARFVEARRAVA